MDGSFAPLHLWIGGVSEQSTRLAHELTCQQGLSGNVAIDFMNRMEGGGRRWTGHIYDVLYALYFVRDCKTEVRKFETQKIQTQLSICAIKKDDSKDI
jgi:hypothetical protein